MFSDFFLISWCLIFSSSSCWAPGEDLRVDPGDADRRADCTLHPEEGQSHQQGEVHAPEPYSSENSISFSIENDFFLNSNNQNIF